MDWVRIKGTEKEFVCNDLIVSVSVRVWPACDMAKLEKHTLYFSAMFAQPKVDWYVLSHGIQFRMIIMKMARSSSATFEHTRTTTAACRAVAFQFAISRPSIVINIIRFSQQYFVTNAAVVLGKRQSAITPDIIRNER